MKEQATENYNEYDDQDDAEEAIYQYETLCEDTEQSYIVAHQEFMDQKTLVDDFSKSILELFEDLKQKQKTLNEIKKREIKIDQELD